MAMTVYNFDRDQCPDMRRITTEADTSKAVQVNIPHYARRVTVTFESGRGGRVALFTDGDNIHADHLKVRSFGSMELEWFGGKDRGNEIGAIYIANKDSDGGVARKVTVTIEGAK